MSLSLFAHVDVIEQTIVSVQARARGHVADAGELARAAHAQLTQLEAMAAAVAVDPAELRPHGQVWDRSAPLHATTTIVEIHPNGVQVFRGCPSVPAPPSPYASGELLLILPGGKS